MPVHVPLPAVLASRIEEQERLLDRLGFDLVRSGPDSVAVHRVPALLKKAEPRALVRDVLETLEAQGSSDAAGMELESVGR